jgi:hypothetical protein
MGLRDPTVQKLGKGSFGSAFEIPLWDRSVLKLTRDPTEVQAAHLLLGKETSRIVNIFGVWAVKSTFRPGLRGWYAVHREYLHPLSKVDIRLVEAIYHVYGDTEVDLTIPRKRSHAMLDKWKGYLRGALAGDGVPMDDEGLRSSFGGGKLIHRAMELLLQIGQAVGEMHSFGIDWEDIHSGNVMRNAKGRLVIADVGWGLMHDSFSEEIPFLTEERLARHIESPVVRANG